MLTKLRAGSVTPARAATSLEQALAGFFADQDSRLKQEEEAAANAVRAVQLAARLRPQAPAAHQQTPRTCAPVNRVRLTYYCVAARNRSVSPSAEAAMIAFDEASGTFNFSQSTPVRQRQGDDSVSQRQGDDSVSDGIDALLDDRSRSPTDSEKAELDEILADPDADMDENDRQFTGGTDNQNNTVGVVEILDSSDDDMLAPSKTIKPTTEVNAKKTNNTSVGSQQPSTAGKSAGALYIDSTELCRYLFLPGLKANNSQTATFKDNRGMLYDVPSYKAVDFFPGPHTKDTVLAATSTATSSTPNTLTAPVATSRARDVQKHAAQDKPAAAPGRNDAGSKNDADRVNGPESNAPKSVAADREPTTTKLDNGKARAQDSGA